MANKRKRRKAPEGVDPNEKRRERLEARRAAKAAAIERQRRAEQRARLIRIAVYTGLFALAVWFFFFRGEDLPQQIAGNEVVEYDDEGEGQHVGPFTYGTSPPVAGPHDPNPAPCGTHAEPVPNEFLVHSLEHGAVYLLYQPTLPLEQIKTLEEIASGADENVLSAPFEGEMPTPVAIGSWGHRMDLSEVDESAINQYIDAFAGKGPESDAGATCENGADQTFEPEEEETPTPGSTPAPTPDSTPTPKPKPTPKKTKS